jgi:hypothetical protein
VLARVILLLWRWRRQVPPKRQLTFNGLHGVISQKIVLFNQESVHNVVRVNSITFFLFSSSFHGTGSEACSAHSVFSKVFRSQRPFGLYRRIPFVFLASVILSRWPVQFCPFKLQLVSGRRANPVFTFRAEAQCLCSQPSPDLVVSSFYSNSGGPGFDSRHTSRISWFYSIPITRWGPVYLRAGRPRNRGFISSRRKIFSLLHSVQTGLGAHPTCYSVFTRGRGVKLSNHLHLVPC